MKQAARGQQFILASVALFLVARSTLITPLAQAKHLLIQPPKVTPKSDLKGSNIGNRILQIQQGFNEKYDTENFLRQMDGQLNQLNNIDNNIKGFKDWVIKQTDKILYHMEHNTDLNTPDTLMRVLYAKRMIEVIL